MLMNGEPVNNYWRLKRGKLLAKNRFMIQHRDPYTNFTRFTKYWNTLSNGAVVEGDYPHWWVNWSWSDSRGKRNRRRSDRRMNNKDLMNALNDYTDELYNHAND